MTQLYTLKVTLKIQAPVLCSSAGTSRWGLDKTVFRNHENKPAIPASHVKGKLREAWTELIKAGAYTGDNQKREVKENNKPAFIPFIEKWLGLAAEEGSYEPIKGRILFSDFVCEEDVPDEKGSDCKDAEHRGHITRIAINRESGTAKEEALLNVESLFPAGKTTSWTGEIEFPAEAREAAEAIRDDILVGLRWVSALGSEKGIGFGVLEEVISPNTEDCWKATESKPVITPPSIAPQSLGIAITMKDPILLGGRRIKDNHLKSEIIITGAVIKGALARCIQRRLLLESSILKKCMNKEDDQKKLDAAGLCLLAEHFENIRFTHAFPSRDSGKRPVVTPLSVVLGGKKDVKKGLTEESFQDAADWEKPRPINIKAPTFAVDWKWKDEKRVKKAYGWAEVKSLAYTRTAIDSVSRRAKEEKLFTYQYVLPEFTETLKVKSEDGQTEEEIAVTKPVTWLGWAFLPNGLTPEECKALSAQLSFVLENWFKHVGKRDARIEKVEIIESELLKPAVESSEKAGAKLVITLQSDALMLTPWDLTLSDNPDLKDYYERFWMNISEDAFTLKQFFAKQVLHGGFIGKRFRTRGQYFPFFLTAAGSVFKLEIKDPTKADAFLKDWETKGLTPPPWALEEYGNPETGIVDWEKCPFTRENGFGEIAVNLELPVILKEKGGQENG